MKYEPLKLFLQRHGRDYVPMTFTEIERVIGARLPPSSKAHRAWWSNNPTNNVMTKEWLAAGYETEQVDIGGEKLVFHRVRKPEGHRQDPSSGGNGRGGAENAPGKMPSYFGCMKGTLTLDPAVDLTEPADPDLADYFDRKYGRPKQ